jgi:hypothetical protein
VRDFLHIYTYKRSVGLLASSLTSCILEVKEEELGYCT